VYCARRRPSRFSCGDDGLDDAGDREEVAIAETAHHHARAMAATNEASGWTSPFRVLVGQIDAELHEVKDAPGVLDPDDYAAAQDLGEAFRRAGSEGVLYPSVRQETGLGLGIFWPDVAGIPRQGKHSEYHWNGNRVDYIRGHSSSRPTFKLGL
jgi:hypothetical protein